MTRKIPLIFALILCLVALFIASCGGGQKSDPANRTLLRVGTDPTYPPFETVNPQTGEIDGFDIELITAIAKTNGWSVEFTAVPFDGMIPGLTGGKYDVAISATTITPERQQVVNFSDPYYLAGQVVAVPFTDTLTTSVTQLSGKRVGVQLGTTGEMMAKKIEGAQVFPFDNIGAAFIDMANGNLDAVLNDFPTTQAYIKAHGTAKTVGELLSSEQYGILIPKSEPELLKQINSGLQKIRTDGTYDSLHVKWFGSLPQ